MKHDDNIHAQRYVPPNIWIPTNFCSMSAHRLYQTSNTPSWSDEQFGKQLLDNIKHFHNTTKEQKMKHNDNLEAPCLVIQTTMAKQKKPQKPLMIDDLQVGDIIEHTGAGKLNAKVKGFYHGENLNAVEVLSSNEYPELITEIDLGRCWRKVPQPHWLFPDGAKLYFNPLKGNGVEIAEYLYKYSAIWRTYEPSFQDQRPSDFTVLNKDGSTFQVKWVSDETI